MNLDRQEPDPLEEELIPLDDYDEPSLDSITDQEMFL